MNVDRLVEAGTGVRSSQIVEVVARGMRQATHLSAAAYAGLLGVDRQELGSLMSMR